MADLEGKAVLSSNLKDAVTGWPDISFHLSRYVSKRMRSTLKSRLLNGQEIKLHAFPRDSAGRHTIATASNTTSASISSYPTRFFENGRLLRSGEMEPGKHIITEKLKSLTSSSLQGWVDRFDNVELQKEFDRI